MGDLGTMAVKILSRDTIKPSSPTPPHLQNHKLSLMDQLTNPNYVLRLLFYSNTTTNANNSHQLKKSLSQTLTLYYPFAGILKDDGLSIDCNDHGVDFWEAQIHCHLSDILKPPRLDALRSLFPTSLVENGAYEGCSLVVLQVNHFLCGGTAIGVCMSHKIADGSTMTAFLNDWAATARQPGEMVLPPHFISSMSDSSSSREPFVVNGIKIARERAVTRRFVFDASKLAELKAMVTSKSVGIQNPTRVEVVTALLHKCALVSTKAISPSSLRPSILCQAANMRAKMDPPMPEKSVGNFVWHFTVSVPHEKEVNLNELVGQLRKNKTEFDNKYAKNVDVNEWFLLVRELFGDAKKLYESNSASVEVYSSSSICRFPFYKVDFGWGKPIWVSISGASAFKNTFILMDSNRDGGIEAWVSLGETEMRVFECDEELLSFASVNPSVLD